MKRALFALTVLAGALAIHAAPAQFPLQLSICPPVQMVPEETEITGFKFNLPYGQNDLVRGFDLGVVGGATRCQAIQVNLFNLVPDRASGVNVALFNLLGDSEGLQVSLMNFVEGDCDGLQIGVLNTAQVVTGLQVGVVNHCYDLHGMQIGLANIAVRAPLPFCVLINAAF